jgi:hypothetical protein
MKQVRMVLLLIKDVIHQFQLLEANQKYVLNIILTPMFPNFGQMIVISKGVYEGKDIEAIRYDSPKHMCGWWLITDDYDDNIESLMTVHYYHVAFKRPDILKYLAIPFGYRFLMENHRVEIIKDEDE